MSHTQPFFDKRRTGRNILWVEQVRIVAMMLVVLAHATDFYLSGVDGRLFWQDAIACLITVAVPTFLLLSGYLRPVNSSPRNLTWIFWGYSAFYAILATLYRDFNLFSVGGIVISLTGYLHLFYILVLLQLDHILSLLNITDNNIKKYLVIFGCVSFFIYFIGSLSIYSDSLYNNIFSRCYEWVASKVFLTWAVFYFFGVYIHYNSYFIKKISNNTVLLLILSIISYLLYISEYDFLYREYISRKYLFLSGFFYQFTGSLFLVSFFSKFKNLTERFVLLKSSCQLGKYTFGVYLIHPAVIIVLLNIIRVRHASIFTVVVFTATSFLLSYFICIIFKLFISNINFSQKIANQ